MKKLFFFAAAAAALISCQDKNLDIDPKPSEDEKLPINLSLEVATKVTDTQFENGDAVGIYVVSYNGATAGTLENGGNLYDNVKFTYNGSWISAESMYWKDKSTKADFYCYHPYGAPANVNAYSFVTSADQSSENDYKASDFLWGKTAGVTPTAEVVQVGTKHILSKVVIDVKYGDGFTAESFAASTIKVGIRSVKTGATINLSNGEVTAAGVAAEVTPFKDGNLYRAIVVPQTVANSSSLIVVTVDGVEYALRKGFTFVSGKQHKFTVTVNKTGSGVNVGITDWETDDNDNGGSAE